MLVLTRKPQQRIVIGDDPSSQVVVTVLEVRGDHVRIGVEAPRSIQVHREEVLRDVTGKPAVPAVTAAVPAAGRQED